MQILQYPKTILCVILFGLIVVVAIQRDSISSLKDEQTRLSINQENLLSENNRELILTKDELKRAVNAKTKLGMELDSVMRELKVKPRTVSEVTIIKVPYHDTIYVPAVSGLVTLQGDKYSIPVSYSNECWGMKGEILSKDSLSSLMITEKTSNNEIDLIRGKKGILWWKKEYFKGRSKCGEFNFTHIIVQ